MAAEGAFSRLGQSCGADSLQEGQRQLQHKLFHFDRRSGEVTAEASPQSVAVSLRCARLLAPDEAVGLLSGSDSTGLMVWDGTALMARCICRWGPRWEVRGAALAELGCGVGAAGALLGKVAPSARLALSDGMLECCEIAVDNMRRNEAEAQLIHEDAGLAEQLAGAPQRVVLRMDWGDAAAAAALRAWAAGPAAPPGCGFDAVFACDVIYCREAVGPLLRSAAALLSRPVQRREEPGREVDDVDAPTFFLSYVPRAWSDGENAAIRELIHEAAAEVGFAPAKVAATATAGGADAGLPITLWEFTWLRD
eukprot:TRINITY_DN23523_c0_g1_i2.p1 TRINITY_DN23523_c0_g1~~TRINITY_DN23523_c0_g1_i2.p1  ORF type:complete len:339 (+),score=67.22 TRINITY_DN23523_c0_g1_i2:91-1017(+)